MPWVGVGALVLGIRSLAQIIVATSDPQNGRNEGRRSPRHLALWNTKSGSHALVDKVRRTVSLR